MLRVFLAAACAIRLVTNRSSKVGIRLRIGIDDINALLAIGFAALVLVFCPETGRLRIFLGWYIRMQRRPPSRRSLFGGHGGSWGGLVGGLAVTLARF